MAYTVLARRYRSATFDEVVGQNHIAQTLKKAIESGRIAHAYLFNGTRGVGKTSMARILAKALNCDSASGPTATPCLKCNSCLAVARGDDIDVIEIDAASNTGVDNIRQIIENSQYRPARSRFKVYIIDEVHMLSKSAFNALLKTLEEPPGHVKFILATTEPEKVLPTILSRCQRYDFRNIPSREIAGHLKAICKDEKIAAEDDALMLVAKAGAGSMRDSLSMLDRLLSIGQKELTTQSIEQLLGLPRGQLIYDLVQAMGEGRVADVLSSAQTVISQGLSTDALLACLADHLHNLLIIRVCGAQSNLVEVASLSMEDLGRQAQRFDPTVLSQDITILEDLRRQMRQSQVGQPLLDATLVRLAMSEQFTAIGDLLAAVNAGGGAAAVKKKLEPVATTGPATASRPESAGRVEATPSPVAAKPMEQPPRAVAAVEVSSHTPTSQPATPAVSAAAEEDDDDDLPQPGRVFEGPSVGKLMKQQAAAARPAASTGAAVANDLAGIWQRLLGELERDKPTLHHLVASGRLIGLRDGQAVIHYTAENDQFPKMLARSGKRELVGEMLSRLCGQAVGVRFEVDAAPLVAPAGISAPTPSPRHPPQGRPSNDEDRAAAPAPINQPSLRPTPDQMAEFERDPLIGGLMSKMGATIIKITTDE